MEERQSLRSIRGEDKLVKKALKAGYKEGIYSDYSRDVIRPSAQEMPRMDAHGLRKCAGRLNRSKRDKYTCASLARLSSK